MFSLFLVFPDHYIVTPNPNSTNLDNCKMIEGNQLLCTKDCMIGDYSIFMGWVLLNQGHHEKQNKIGTLSHWMIISTTLLPDIKALSTKSMAITYKESVQNLSNDTIVTTGTPNEEQYYKEVVLILPNGGEIKEMMYFYRAFIVVEYKFTPYFYRTWNGAKYYLS